MNFIRERKCCLMLMKAGKAVADNGRKSVKFSIHDAHSLMNIRIVSVYGDYQYIVEIANFSIENMYWKLTD